jgi:hypothetical protein
MSISAMEPTWPHFVSAEAQMTDYTFVERLGLLKAGHAAHRECYPDKS